MTRTQIRPFHSEGPERTFFQRYKAAILVGVILLGGLGYAASEYRKMRVEKTGTADVITADAVEKLSAVVEDDYDVVSANNEIPEIKNIDAPKNPNNFSLTFGPCKNKHRIRIKVTASQDTEVDWMMSVVMVNNVTIAMKVKNSFTAVAGETFELGRNATANGANNAMPEGVLYMTKTLMSDSTQNYIALKALLNDPAFDTLTGTMVKLVFASVGGVVGEVGREETQVLLSSIDRLPSAVAHWEQAAPTIIDGPL